MTKSTLSQITILLCGTGLAALVSSPAMAAEAQYTAPAKPSPPPAQSTADADQAQSLTPDIVVTAGKREQRLADVPASINVVTKAFLDQKAANQLTDYLPYLPNVVLKGQGVTGFARITMRGITVSGNGSTVGTYIDDAPFGSSTVFVLGANLQPDLDPSILQQIEVLKGPQGTLYGAGSTGGLIRYVTRTPDAHQLSFGGSLEGTTQDHGDQGYALRAHANLPIVSDTVALTISAFARRDPGFIDNIADGKRDENWNQSNGVQGSLLIAPTPRLTVRINALYQALTGHGIDAVFVNPGPDAPSTGLQGSPVYGRYTTRLFGNPGNRSRDGLYSLNVDYDLGFATLTSITSYSTIRGAFSSGDSGYDNADYGVPDTDRLSEVIGSHINKDAEEVRLTSPSGGRFQWQVGGFYTHENTLSTNVLSATDQQGAPDQGYSPGGAISSRRLLSTYTEYSAFASATYTIVPRFDLTVGGRYSSYQQNYTQLRAGTIGNPANPGAFRTYAQASSDDNKLTYVATLTYHLPGDGVIYARTATGFRPSGPSVLPPNAKPPAGFTGIFRPETLYSYEVGIRHDFFDRKLNIDASAFYINDHDLQGTVLAGRFSYIGNSGNATSRGVEATATLRPTRGLTVTGSFGYTNSTLDEDEPNFGAHKGDTLPNAPHYTASGNVEYVAPLNESLDWFVGGGVRYVSSQHGDFSTVADLSFPSEAVADLQAGVRRSTFSISLFVRNLTNTYKYDADTRVSDNGPALVAVTPPRIIGIRIGKEFR